MKCGKLFVYPCLKHHTHGTTCVSYISETGIRTLDKVDLAGRVTILPEETFLHINRALICINVSISFYVFFKNWPVNINATFEVFPVISSFWMDFYRSGRPLFDEVETTSSVCMLLEIEYVK